MGDPKKGRRSVVALRLIDALRAGESNEYIIENKILFLQTAVRDLMVSTRDVGPGS